MRVDLHILILLLSFCKLDARFHRPSKLHVCIVTCDFWGLPAAGGTATAYHLLASYLADNSPSVWPVTFLGATHQSASCQDLQRNFSSGSVKFECLQPEHFTPKVVDNFPYESIGVAVVRWLQSAGRHCDVIHTHEWGGGMQQMAAYVSMRHMSNQRLVVEPHGGHYWSSQGTRHRPTDLLTLRIDDHERLTMHFADDVISPSAYMLAHLRQRGWHLPPASSVIPNIVPQAAHSSEVRQLQAVWRLAFFGRLEERKGLKLFCSAIEMLDTSQLPKLEVIFIGGEAQVDMLPSIQYIKARTATWPMPVMIYGGLPRSAALRVLKRAGTLIAFTSLVENLPFALAEACIEQIPLITFNVGGVAELIDPKAHDDVIVESITSTALFERLTHVLHEGSLRTSVLHPTVKQSAALWHKFHSQLDRMHDQAYRRHDRMLSATPDPVLDVVRLSTNLLSKDLKKSMCRKRSRNTAFLLVPNEYDFPTPAQVHNLTFVASQLHRLRESRNLGALVFGALLPNDMVSYPTSPTWIIYHGSEPVCVENTPMLILADLFCTHFLAEAGDFSFYHTWVLIHHLRLAGLVTATFPEPVFVLNNFSRAGSGCFSDRIPHFRKLDGIYASNLMGPSEEVLIAQHLAPLPRPTVSFRSDFDRFQGQHGWHYIAIDAQGREKALQWAPADGVLTENGKWTCSDSPLGFITQTSLHPCALPNEKCCEADAAAVGVRYVSNLWDMAALIELTFEVWPTCGDGLTLQWVLTHANTSTTLMSKEFTAAAEAQPYRETVEKTVALFPGDDLLFLVSPGANHDCDGVYVHDIKIWQSKPISTSGVL